MAINEELLALLLEYCERIIPKSENHVAWDGQLYKDIFSERGISKEEFRDLIFFAYDKDYIETNIPMLKSNIEPIQIFRLKSPGDDFLKGYRNKS
jgi:hypothetical protein